MNGDKRSWAKVNCSWWEANPLSLEPHFHTSSKQSKIKFYSFANDKPLKTVHSREWVMNNLLTEVWVCKHNVQEFTVALRKTWLGVLTLQWIDTLRNTLDYHQTPCVPHFLHLYTECFRPCRVWLIWQIDTALEHFWLKFLVLALFWDLSFLRHHAIAQTLYISSINNDPQRFWI